MTEPRRPSARARSLARRNAVQAIYQWQMTGQSVADIEKQFLEQDTMRRADGEYFSELLHRVPTMADTLDDALRPLLDRPAEQLDPVERAILRLGAYELRSRPDVPWRVVINEAVELARTFGAAESHRYVNGILDRLARDERAVEIGAAQA